MTKTSSQSLDSTIVTEYALQKFISENPVLMNVVRHVRKMPPLDVAHDLSHLSRVLANGIAIMQQEGGDPEILVAAALLHDIKTLPKDHPQAKSSSSLSARHAAEVLGGLGFPKQKIPIVQEAILCHSFTRGLVPKTLEAKILQDADRLDGLGAIGIARLFSVGGNLGRAIYFPEDPFSRSGRTLDDKKYSVDHFFQKLFKLVDLMHTETAKQLAADRVEIMRQYLDVLEREINPALERFICETS